MALPILNNESQRLSEVIELSTEINMTGFQDLTNLFEKQFNVLQDIKDVLYDQYESYLAAERERRENEREARNNSNPAGLPGDSSSSDNAGGSGGSGGSGGFGGAKLAVGGGLLGIGLAMKGLAFGLGAFANPKVAIGGGVVLAFLAGLAGVSWLAGKAAQEIGQGFKEISSGIDALDETGKKVEMDNLVAAGKGLGAFLENVGSLKGSFGAVITFLTGDLVNIANGMDKLNTMNIDKEKLIAAGEGLNAFMSAMGEGSFFGKLVGSISTAIAPDMEKLASGFSKLSDVSKTFDLAKFKDMAAGMAAIADPLAEFGKSGIVANFVGDEALSDIASGITALNNTQVDRLETVAKGIKFLDNDLWEIVKTAFAANFVGKNSLKDIGDGITALNKTEVDRLETVAKGIKFLDNDLWEIVKTAFAANFVGENALTDIAKGINYLNKTQVDRLETVGAGLETIKTPLLNFTGIGLAANFVGKNAIIDIADGAKDIMEKIGTDEKVKQAENVAKSLNNMREALSSFTTSQVWNTLKAVGANIIGFFAGDENPIDAILSLSNEADNLSKTATALEKISKALNSFSGISFNTDNMNFEALAKNLGNTIPLLDKLANGGVYKKIFGANIDFDKGILDPNLKLDQVAEMIKKVRVVLGFEDTKATNVSNGTNNTSTNVSNGTNNTSTNVPNGTNNTSTNVPNGTDNTSTDVSNGTDNTSTSVPGKKPQISGKLLVALKEAEKERARFAAADTNGDGKLSQAELEALHAKERQERRAVWIARADRLKSGETLDGAGKPNTSTDVSDVMDPYDAELLRLAGQTASPRNVSNGTNNTSTNVFDKIAEISKVVFNGGPISEFIINGSISQILYGTLTRNGEAGPELTIPNASGKVIPKDVLQTTLARNGEAIYQGSNEVSNLMNGGTTIIAPTNVSDNSVKTTNNTSSSGNGANVRTTDDSVRAFNSNPYM
jgi:hypothetical protein